MSAPFTQWQPATLNRYLKEHLEGDYRLQDLWVTGELANLSTPKSGHLYFTIKDSAASLRVVMWKTSAQRLTNLPKIGEQVVVHGRISLYEATGDVQLYADSLISAGMGDLSQQFERLKLKLMAEGLFDSERKRPLPDWPHAIGVVTSPSAAAFQDVLNVLRRRWPLAQVTLFPSVVQGETAPAEITRALLAAYRFAPDVILIVRGGGSAEDLWCFNDEQVVRMVAQSPIPTIAGIGHEIDFTLTDFAADVRAPTPSAAAEQATPNRDDLLPQIIASRRQLQRAMHDQLRTAQNALALANSQLAANSPRHQIVTTRQRIDFLLMRGQALLTRNLTQRRTNLNRLDSLLAALNPQSVLNRGYAILTQASNGQLVRQVGQVQPGSTLVAQLSDGRLTATVTAIQEDKSDA